MEQRLRDLESTVADLREDRAAQALATEHLQEAVKELSVQVGELRDTINRSRGALWVILGLGTAGGGILTALLSKWFGVN